MTDSAPAGGYLSRHRGPVSLALAGGGLLACEAAIWAGWLPGAEGRVLATAFEGATVGGLADWFAVSALFHRIPLPGLSRHTDLLARKRERLAEGIVEMTETRWLAPDVLRERLAGVSFAGLIADYLRDPARRDAVRRALRGFVLPMTAALEQPALQEALAAGLRQGLTAERLAGIAGRGMAQALAEPSVQSRLADVLALSLRRALAEPALRDWLTAALLSALADYAGEGWWESTKLKLARLFVDGDDDRERVSHLVGMLVVHADGVLREVENDPAHPLRQELAATLAGWGSRLAGGQPATVMLGELLRRVLEEQWRPQGPLAHWLAGARAGLDRALADPVSPVSQRLDALIGGGIAHFLTHAETRDSFDASARRLLVEVIESRPGLIGDTVRLSLSEERLPTRELVRQIEDKVGDELQWIRVNGAVIGGLAAGAIALVRYALS
ncbi:DUF445 domain-containing protein [Laribacter hongkongensis]|uniref:DUF445 domain-containing protein n=1 Tax=Laribacter hongkongensis TaxID=168471 RepID=UPI001EFDD40E|nr:DUF445 domain-containing protein [Laribacter hongkongensis]MCG9083130.1 DUF445 domain-containing protein [Laribacter hongkongensis]